MFDIAITPASSLSYLGNTYRVASGHQPMLELFGDNINLWAVWNVPGCHNCPVLGDVLKNVSSSSTGGTQVPEPGMIGLLGIGAAALVWRRRRGQAHAAA
jgi:hypothetical protein